MKSLGYSLIALSILLVGGMFAPRFYRSSPPRLAAAKTQIGAFTTALSAFKQDVGNYPPGANGLVELLRKPEGASGWRGPYLEEKGGIPKDPWNRPYIYECPGKHNTAGFDISSAGLDGMEGTADDIANWLVGK
jgi:general secretion pathway protein G